MEKRYEKKVLEKGTTIYGDHTNPPIPEGYWYCRENGIMDILLGKVSWMSLYGFQ